MGMLTTRNTWVRGAPRCFLSIFYLSYRNMQSRKPFNSLTGAGKVKCCEDNLLHQLPSQHLLIWAFKSALPEHLPPGCLVVASSGFFMTTVTAKNLLWAGLPVTGDGSAQDNNPVSVYSIQGWINKQLGLSNGSNRDYPTKNEIVQSTIMFVVKRIGLGKIRG